MAYLDNSGLSYFWSKIKAFVIGLIPTKVSDLQNDSGYLTLATLPVYDGTVV